MSLSLRRNRSTERYSQTLRPSVFAIKTDGKERPAPWLARVIKWIVAMRPEQTRRALWLSKPVDWFKKIYSTIRRMTPKQLSRTMWLTRLFYRIDKIFPSRRNTTFGSIKNAMDNSHFRHLSKPEESPKMRKQ